MAERTYTQEEVERLLREAEERGERRGEEKALRNVSTTQKDLTDEEKEAITTSYILGYDMDFIIDNGMAKHYPEKREKYKFYAHMLTFNLDNKQARNENIKRMGDQGMDKESFKDRDIRHAYMLETNPFTVWKEKTASY